MSFNKNLVGALILKWLNKNYVEIEKNENGITSFKFIDGSKIENEFEKKLFDFLKKASRDGNLQSFEFTHWCEFHYDDILKWYDSILKFYRRDSIEKGYIDEEINDSSILFEPKSCYTINDGFIEDYLKLAGLKKFFDEFDNMSDKNIIEVKLWNDYLVYAQLFGMADKIAKKLKVICPEIIYSLNEIQYLNNISCSVYNIASNELVRVTKEENSTSSGSFFGGGGFSSGGGGGGSFGGGGGSFGGGSR